MISFFEIEPELQTLSDADFLSQIQWKASASAKLSAASKKGDVLAVASELQRRLQKKTFTKTSDKKKQLAFERILWSRDAFEETPRTADLADELLRSDKHWDSFLKSWLKKVTSEKPITSFELLILLELVQRTGKNLSSKVFWKLWRITFSASVELSNHLEEPLGGWPTRDQILLTQGELPWVAGGLFCDVKSSASFRKCGRNLLRKELLNNTDVDGTPQAELFPCLLFWFAALTRVSHHAEQHHTEWWGNMAFAHFRNKVRALTCLLHSDGRVAFSDGTKLNAVMLLQQAAKLTYYRSNSRTRRLLKSVEERAVKNASKKQTKLISKLASSQKNHPVLQSDWGEVACLRSDWTAEADLLAVNHSQKIPQLELSVAGQMLLDGNWDIAVSIDGEPIPITNEWICSCWSSDEDADYLELQLELTDHIKIERQILLSRTERMALLADVVSGAGESRVDYYSQLPIVKQAALQPDLETREWTATRKGLFTRLFPLALPQNRVQSVAGQFALSKKQTGAEKQTSEERLELHQAAIGGIYAPLLLCWHPRRKRAYADWRKLTITQDGTRLKSDAASGHRLRLGSRQWFLYHNVNKEQKTRALLGHHTLNETVFGYLNTEGDVEPILLVE